MTPVAVKEYLDTQAFQREYNFYRRVRKWGGSHPNLLANMGAFQKDKNSCMVFELCQYGTLAHVLRTNQIDERDRLEICLQVARTMHWLIHGPLKTFHRDLKAENVLVSAQWVVKVTDFSICKSETTSTEQLPSGTIPWMAPEFLRDKEIAYSEKTEVYSFGVTMWEVFHSGQEPYPGMQPVQILF